VVELFDLASTASTASTAASPSPSPPSLNQHMGDSDSFGGGGGSGSGDVSEATLFNLLTSPLLVESGLTDEGQWCCRPIPHPLFPLLPLHAVAYMSCLRCHQPSSTVISMHALQPHPCSLNFPHTRLSLPTTLAHSFHHSRPPPPSPYSLPINHMLPPHPPTHQTCKSSAVSPPVASA
jgi:hypothetical protein